MTKRTLDSSVDEPESKRIRMMPDYASSFQPHKSLIDHVGYDAMDIICAYLSLPVALNTVGLLNHAYHHFVIHHSPIMWAQFKLRVYTYKDKHRLKNSMPYVKHIARLSVHGTYRDHPDEDQFFYEALHEWLQEASPHLIQLRMESCYYLYPLAHYSWKCLQKLTLIDTVPLNLYRFHPVPPIQVKILTINIGCHERAHNLCNINENDAVDEDQLARYAFSHGWDWSLLHAIGVEDLGIGGYDVSYTKDDGCHGQAIAHVSPHLIHRNRESLQSITLFMTQGWFCPSKTMPYMIEVLCQCHRIKKLYMYSMDDEDNVELWLDWHSTIINAVPMLKMLYFSLPSSHENLSLLYDKVRTRENMHKLHINAY